LALRLQYELQALEREAVCSYILVATTLDGPVPWTWSAAKNRGNKRKHGLSFETACLVFDDPRALSRLDPYQDEECWQTVGLIGQVTVFVVHTWPEDRDEVGRIISARKATAHERRAYEEGGF
jgi:uncharacterized DUF497 family protein